MALAEVTLDAARCGFLSSIADTISSPNASSTRPAVSIPDGAWAVLLGQFESGQAGDTMSVSDAAGHTWTPLHAFDITSQYGLWAWHNDTGAPVSIAVTFHWTFTFNDKAGTWIGAITAAAATTPSVAVTLSNASTAEATATPTQVGSLFCLHYIQLAPSADLSSLDAGSAVDSSPASTAFLASGPAAIGTVHRTAPSADTSTPLTVGAAEPTGAQTFGVLVEYFPPAGGTPATASGTLTLGGSSTWTAPPAGGTVTLGGTARPSTAATGAISLTGAAAATAPPAGGAVNLSGTAPGQAPAAATGSVALSGTATWQAPPAGGRITLTATGAAPQAPSSAAGKLALAGTATTHAPAAATGTLSFGGAAAVNQPALLARAGPALTAAIAGPARELATAGPGLTAADPGPVVMEE